MWKSGGWHARGWHPRAWWGGLFDEIITLGADTAVGARKLRVLATDALDLQDLRDIAAILSEALRSWLKRTEH